MEANNHDQFTAEILSSSSSYYQIMEFITKQYIEQNAGTNGPNKLMFSHVEQLKAHNELVYYFPENTKITIDYKGDLIECEAKTISSDHGTNNHVKFLSCLTLVLKSKDILDNLILDMYKTQKSLNVKSFDVKSQNWRFIETLQSRPEESIVMDKKILSNLFEDIELFCSKESEEEYDRFGQVYKRNFLLHGVPGSGKSSLVKVIANKFKRSIYTLSFDPSLTDNSLMVAISSINDKNAILLIEDLDCIFQNRDDNNKSNVTFSALLNVLDGISSPKGLIIIITCNHVDKFEKALLRPGRINMMIKFTRITKTQLVDLLKIHSLNLEKEIINKIFTLCVEKDLVTATISEFLFRHRRKKLSDAEYLNLFEEYLEEINPVFVKKTATGMFG